MAETKARNALMVKSILDTATELFDQRGYTETRMQDIASAMGVTRPSLYYYFNSKEEILVALLIDLISVDKVLMGVDDPALPALDRLRNLMRRIGRQVVDQPARLRIVNRHFAQAPEKFRKDFTRQRRRVRSALITTIVEAVAEGALRPVDPELATSIIFGAITGIPDWYHPSSETSAEETIETITSVLLTGIALPAEGRYDGTVPGVIRRIGEDLAYLERLTQTALPTPSVRPAPSD